MVIFLKKKTMIPIYKDTYLTVDGELSPISYTIKDGEETIFNGKAWVKPNAENIEIKINEICSDFVHPLNIELEYSTETKTYEHPQAIKTFEVVETETDNLLGSYTFIYDWSYDSHNFTTLSKPINGKKSVGMFDLETYVQNGKVYTDVSTVETGSMCGGEWAIYYVNSYGGWDSFLIEGSVVRKDGFVRYKTDNSINNNLKSDFGSKIYQTNIVPAYTITTGWVNDTESEIIAKNVFGTPYMYLHNLISGEIIPVNIDNGDATHKTFKNNGRKLVNYTINVISAQELRRK